MLNLQFKLELKLYYIHWGSTLIEHFLQRFWSEIGFVLGTNSVLVSQVVGFAITLITFTVFFFFFFFESATWELNNKPEPTATILQRQNFPRILQDFDVIASYNLLRGESYTAINMYRQSNWFWLCLYKCLGKKSKSATQQRLLHILESNYVLYALILIIADFLK